MAVYHERQARADSCRMHATNACLGRAAYTWPTFLAMCDEFSALTGGQLSRAEYHAGDGITLFGYALQRAGAVWPTLPLAMYKAGTSDNKKTAARLEYARAHALGAIVYNAGHVWYLKRHGPGWVKVDSLGGGVSATTLDSVWRDGLGVEIIFPEGCDLTPVIGGDDTCAPPRMDNPPPQPRMDNPPPQPRMAYPPPQPRMVYPPPQPRMAYPPPRLTAARVVQQSPPRVVQPPRLAAPRAVQPPRLAVPRAVQPPVRVLFRLATQAPTAQRRNGLGFALRR
jgi:hypothetical protein